MSRIFANIWESDRFFSDNIDNRHHLTPWIKPMVIYCTITRLACSMKAKPFYCLGIDFKCFLCAFVLFSKHSETLILYKLGQFAVGVGVAVDFV